MWEGLHQNLLFQCAPCVPSHGWSSTCSRETCLADAIRLHFTVHKLKSKRNTSYLQSWPPEPVIHTGSLKYYTQYLSLHCCLPSPVEHGIREYEPSHGVWERRKSKHYTVHFRQQNKHGTSPLSREKAGGAMSNRIKSQLAMSTTTCFTVVS